MFNRIFGSFVRVLFSDESLLLLLEGINLMLVFHYFFNDLCLTGVSHFGCRKHAASPGKRPEPCQFKFTGQQREKNSTPEYAFYVRLN